MLKRSCLFCQAQARAIHYNAKLICNSVPIVRPVETTAPVLGASIKKPAIELPNFLDDLNNSVSKWKIVYPSPAPGTTHQIADPERLNELRLPPVEENVAEKQCRIGGKYKRPAFKRLRIRRRHLKKSLRKNKHKIKQEEMRQREEELSRWREEFKEIQAKGKEIKSSIEELKAHQRMLQKRVRDLIKQKPGLVDSVEKDLDPHIKSRLKVLDTVEKVVSEEEVIIQDIYKTS